jgi:hypothetical protein
MTTRLRACLSKLCLAQHCRDLLTHQLAVALSKARGEGLPPRARGRPAVRQLFDFTPGATPASAGTTSTPTAGRMAWRGYPRERGDDTL